MPPKRTPEEFEKIANEIHNNKYEYIVRYQDCKTNIMILCPIKGHGTTELKPYNHIKKFKPKGCQKCAPPIVYAKKNRTMADIIKEAKAVHGDKYEYYEDAEYKNVDTEIPIHCSKPNHGDFWQTPYAHINQGQGCRKCGSESSARAKTKSTIQFILDAKKAHGNRYIYDKKILNYTKSKNDVVITCRKHGNFSQSPDNHLAGKGCWDCAHEKIGFDSRLSNDEFLKRAKNIHGNRYAYINKYETDETPLAILCNIHGIFYQTPACHIRSKSGCQKCAQEKINKANTYTTIKFLDMARDIHGDKYIYDKELQYTGIYVEIPIICKKHGEFWQTPRSHLMGRGCQTCGLENRIKLRTTTFEEFKLQSQEKHGDKYKYVKSTYKNYHTPMEIICSMHGIFLQTPGQHTLGRGCSLCKNKTEAKLFEWLKSNNFRVEYQKKFDWCKGKSGYYLRFDFYLPDYNIIIELDGNQHFFQVLDWLNPEEVREIDGYKMDLANLNGLSVIRIHQVEVWKDKHNWKIPLLETIKCQEFVINTFMGDIYKDIYY